MRTTQFKVLEEVSLNNPIFIEALPNEMYYLKSAGADERDFIFLVGNCQALAPEGQYELCGSILDFVESKGAKEFYTLGGLATGQPIEGTDGRVLGAATDEERIEMLKEADVEIRSADGAVSLVLLVYS